MPSKSCRWMMDDGWWWHWWAAGDNRQATPGKPALGTVPVLQTTYGTCARQLWACSVLGLAWTLTWNVLMKVWSPATNKK